MTVVGIVPSLEITEAVRDALNDKFPVAAE